MEALYDAEATHVGTPGMNFYRDELIRRESARREKQLLKYTDQIRWLTFAVAFVSILAVVIAVVALVRAP